MKPSAHDLARQALAAGFLGAADLDAVRLERIGRYEVRELLGEGAAGEVYRAHDPLMQREVAIKLIKPGPSTARLERELQVLAQLDHPGVVAIHDAGVAEGRSFFVMPYVGRETLGSCELSLERWVEALVGVLEACDYVHGQGIVHRDLKPANVLLDDEGRPAIVDFGIAKLLVADERLTRTGAILGTPLYMAPEQLGGREVDGRADVYSAGVMLYERLCARFPYEGETLMQIVARITSDEPPLPPSGEGIPPALARIALRAIQTDPASRYPSAAAMVAALRSWQRGGALRWAPLASGALVLAGLVFGAGIALSRPQVTPSESAAEEARGPSFGATDSAPAASQAQGATEPAATEPAATEPAATQPTPQEPAPQETAPQEAAAQEAASPAPSSAAPAEPRASLAQGALARWGAAPPTRDQLAQAFEDLAAELPREPSADQARSFARICWATTFRALDEEWAPPGALAGLTALSQREASTESGRWVRGVAAGLRWWFERDPEGRTQSHLFEIAARALKAEGAPRWELDLSACVIYLSMLHKESSERRVRQRLVRRKAEEKLTRLRSSAPASEAALVAELERRFR